MPWNPWVLIEPDDTNDPAVQDLYKKARNPITGKLSDLTRITSATPEAAAMIKQLCDVVFGGADGLTPREKEIAALVTSSFNGCVH